MCLVKNNLFEGEIAEALEKEIMSQMPDDFETDFDLDSESDTTEAGTIILTFQGQEGALAQHQADIMSVLESVHILEY